MRRAFRNGPLAWAWAATGVHAVLTLVSIGAFAVMIGRPVPGGVDAGEWARSYQWGMAYMGALVLVLGFLGAWLALWAAAGPIRATLGALLVTGFTLSIELVGAATGLPFGAHSYGTALGWRVAGLVPFTIPLSWFMMLFATLGIALRAGLRIRYTVLLATVGLLAWDVLMEPAMSAAFPFWVWRESGIWHGMPLANWIAWAVIGPLIGLLLHRATRPHLPAIASTRLPEVIYVVNGALPLAMALRYELHGAAAVGGAAMLAFLLLPARLKAFRRGRVLAQAMPVGK
ncbi:MAG: carotenoid biosynthesis protein [Gemmatimonadales bacterium]